MVNHNVRLLAMLGLRGCFATLIAVVLATQAIAQDNKPAEKKDQAKKAAQALRPTGASTILTEKGEIKPQGLRVKKGKSTGAKTTAEFLKPNHDFGEQWVGGKLKHTFEVRNTGQEPFNILNVRPSCGCTLAGSYDKVVQPGEIGKIPISVDTKKLYGKFKKSIRVTTNATGNENTTLTIAGEVKHYVEISPRYINFRELKPNEAKDLTIKLTNNVEQPLELTLENAKLDDSFTAEIVEKVPGKEFEVIVHAKPPYTGKRVLKQLRVKTNNPEQPQVTIRLSATMLARLEIKPAQLVMSRPRPTEYTQTISIDNYGDTPVHLLDASVDDDKLSVESKEIEPGKKYQVALKIPAGYSPDTAGNTLTLKFDDSEKPIVEVPIRSSARRVRPAQKLEGKPAPVATFTTHGGYKVNTADIKDEALVLKFYASWCGYCKKSLPNIEKIYQEYKDKGVRFIAVNLDDPNASQKRRAFTKEQSLAKLKELGVTFDVAFDPTKEIGKLFKVSSFPTMFVIDKSSKVAKVEMGAIQGRRIQTFKKQLDAILAAQSAKASAEPAAEPAASGTQ